MGDPLADMLHQESDPYRESFSNGVLHQLFTTNHPQVLAEAAGEMLKRLVVLEMYMEEELDLTIPEKDLKKFIEKHTPEIVRETEKLATIFFGSIARREGG